MEIKKFENFIPSGWINVKVDKQIQKRMTAYIDVLDSILIDRSGLQHSTWKDKSKWNNLFAKIELLDTIDEIIDDDSIHISKKLSLITILQYLKEIKEHFTASSSGFLMECFIASLINAEVPDDNGSVDVRSSMSYKDEEAHVFKSKSITYQIKLYEDGSTINVGFPPFPTPKESSNKKSKKERCDFYVICVKRGNDIDVSIFDGKNENDDSYIGKFQVNQKIDGKNYNPNILKLNTGTIKYNKFKYKKTLQLGDIENMIQRCAEHLQSVIKKLYDNVSKLHYDIESMITGYEIKDGKSTKPITFEKARKIADGTLDEIRNNISNLNL